LKAKIGISPPATKLTGIPAVRNRINEKLLCNRMTEQITGLENDSDNVNNQVLEVIRELFDTCGAQSFAEILSEVRTQCVGVNSLESAHKVVKDSLAYLVKLGSVKEVNDEFGIVYGNSSDF
jgi:hypothetical protein